MSIRSADLGHVGFLSGPGLRLLLLAAMLAFSLRGVLRPGAPAPPDGLGFLARPEADPDVRRGAELFLANGCNSCHAVTGERIIGPGLGGVYGSVQPLDDGSTVVADADYIRESVLRPEAKIVAGYPPSMPSYEGLVDEADVDALVAYLASLR